MAVPATAPTPATTPVAGPDAGPDTSRAAVRPEDLARIINRLRRAEGQLAGVIRMLEDGRDCGDVMPQLAAVSKAISRAGFAIVASNLQECLAHPEAEGTKDMAALEKLFLSLA